MRRSTALGDNHPDTLSSLHILGKYLNDQEKCTEAECIFRDVWEARNRVLGNKHADTLNSIYELGDAFYHQEKYTQAEAAYRDVWVRRCQALGTKHAEALACLGRLSDALFNQVMLPEAELVYRDVWDLRKKPSGNIMKILFGLSIGYAKVFATKKGILKPKPYTGTLGYAASKYLGKTINTHFWLFIGPTRRSL